MLKRAWDLVCKSVFVIELYKNDHFSDFGENGFTFGFLVNRRGGSKCDKPRQKTATNRDKPQKKNAKTLTFDFEVFKKTTLLFLDSRFVLHDNSWFAISGVSRK